MKWQPGRVKKERPFFLKDSLRQGQVAGDHAIKNTSLNDQIYDAFSLRGLCACTESKP